MSDPAFERRPFPVAASWKKALSLGLTGTLVLLLLLTAPVSAQIPFSALRFLKPDGQISPALLTECSGLVHSLRYNGVFWAHGDGGSGASIVPVTASGKLARGWTGAVRVEGCKNNDWEDIALDEKGNLIIADVGNNNGRRKQLMLHFVNEPKPGAVSVRPTRTLRVHYEDQKGDSPDYDCEAVFSAGGRIYFLTKHRSDKRTRLYRLDGESTTRSNPLRLVGSFDVGGMVTAADASPDGKLVAVLTYTTLWVFSYDRASGSIFTKSESVRRTPIFAWQAEAVAWEGKDALVIANENGQLFRVALSSLQAVR
ncbi:MAG: hypothetical protein JHC85_01925 [Chthoniobacterales bacterium]|nr:hypothetical protein [Chthoniobacterales bacterium]